MKPNVEVKEAFTCKDQVEQVEEVWEVSIKEAEK
jgi:hypothetical protein